jgi:ketosteroid isomerase-like protein
VAEADVALVREVYAAFERGDLDGVVDALDPEIEWIEPDGYFPGAQGVFHGRDDVRRIFELYPRLWERFDVTPEELIDAGDHVVMVGTERGVARDTGKEFTGRVCNVWTLRDGKAVRLRIFKDTALIREALA